MASACKRTSATRAPTLPADKDGAALEGTTLATTSTPKSDGTPQINDEAKVGDALRSGDGKIPPTRKADGNSPRSEDVARLADESEPSIPSVARKRQKEDTDDSSDDGKEINAKKKRCTSIKAVMKVAHEQRRTTNNLSTYNAPSIVYNRRKFPYGSIVAINGFDMDHYN